MKRIFKSLFVLMMVIVTMTLSTTTAYAKDNGSFYSIDEEFFMHVFTVPSLGNGAFLDDFDYFKANVDVLTGSGNTYSLYDRFGANTPFFDYHGEFNATLGASDQIFTWMVNGDMTFSIQKVIDLIVGPPEHHTLTRTYTGRKEVQNTIADPRYGQKISRGMADFNGEFSVNYANYIVESTVKYPMLVTGALLDDRLSIKALDLLSGDQSFLPTFVSSVKDTALMVGVLAFMVRIIILFTRYAKGQSGMKQLFHMLGNFILSMVIFGVIIAQPTFPAKIAKSLVTTANKVINVASSQLDTSPISAGSDPVHINTAIMWDHVVVRPWMANNLGLSSYEDGEIVISNEPVAYGWPVEKNPNLSVSLGGGSEERNIAAIWYSLLNEYHIELDRKARQQQLTTGESDSNAKNGVELIAKGAWPTAEKTNNGVIYADHFRVIDAMFNVDGEKVLRAYEPTPIQGAYKILVLGIVTVIGLFCWGFRKLMLSVQLGLATFNLFYSAFMMLVRGDRSVFPPLQTIWMAFKSYIALSLYMLMVMTVYAITIDKGVVEWILFILFSLAAYRHSKKFIESGMVETGVAKVGGKLKNIFSRIYRSRS